jgi:hypothetical protein
MKKKNEATSNNIPTGEVVLPFAAYGANILRLSDIGSLEFC